MSSEGQNDLGERIAQAQAASGVKAEAKRKLDAEDGKLSAGAYALRYGAEFVACIFVGGLIGFWIDAFAGTKPWGLLIVGTLGFAAGIRAMMRAYRELNARALGNLSEPEAPTDGTGNE